MLWHSQIIVYALAHFDIKSMLYVDQLFSTENFILPMHIELEESLRHDQR